MSATSERTPAVRLDAGPRGEPVGVHEFHASVVHHCADAVALSARHRTTLPLGCVAEVERHIERQRAAVLSLDTDCIEHIGAWWERSADAGDPAKAWSAVYLLASLGGDMASKPVQAALELLPNDGDDWMAAAAALALASPGDPAALGEALLSSLRPAARAVGLDLLARHGALSQDALRGHLAREDGPVCAATVRAASRMRVVTALASEITACLGAPSGAVAWEAARALTVAGVQEPYFNLQAGGSLASALGARGVELLVMAGDGDDIGVFEHLLASTPMTAPLLSAVARFGNVTAWSFLLHYLTEPELADAAVAALRTLFGDLVPESEAPGYMAWKRAIGEARFNPTLRYRRGRPWHPSTVVAECTSGELSRVEVERRIDELAARTLAEPQVDLGLWAPDWRRGLATFASEAEARGMSWRPGAWRS